MLKIERQRLSKIKKNFKKEKEKDKKTKTQKAKKREKKCHQCLSRVDMEKGWQWCSNLFYNKHREINDDDVGCISVTNMERKKEGVHLHVLNTKRGKKRVRKKNFM